MCSRCPEYTMSLQYPDRASGPLIHNRLRALLLHIPWYSIEGQARLAADLHVARSTVSRLVNGRFTPSYRLVEKVTQAVSQRMGKAIDARDLFTTDGTYPTPSACALCDCSGCLPPWAWDERWDRLRPEWRDARPGDWSMSVSGAMEELTHVENRR